MIYIDEQLTAKIKDMIIKFEDEVVEFKEAWLIFGVDNKRNILGTAYRQDGNLQNLKKEIVGGTNERAAFMEIYDLEIDKRRIVAFQIPPATRGIPTTWNGAAYAREDENTCPLPMDLIRSQIGVDWSQEIVENADFSDLDEDAVAYARELFLKKQNSQMKHISTIRMW